MAGWFFFDGLVGYPFSNKRWLKHKEFEDRKQLQDWPAYARSQGWTEAPPHKFHSPSDSVTQHLFGLVGTLIGGGALLYWFTQKKRVIRTDEKAVYTPTGKRVPFEAITGVNRKQWESKGLATVRYSVDGRTGKFVLDDYKYSCEPTHHIMKEIEEELTARSARLS